MFNLVLTNNGVFSADGIPEYYLKDEDVERILKDESFAKGLRSFFNKDVCIGRLGIPTEGVYQEKHLDIQSLGEKTENLCYYEEVSNDKS